MAIKVYPPLPSSSSFMSWNFSRAGRWLNDDDDDDDDDDE
jgi:hypothetical protein